jgi:glutathione S-transferase
MVPTFPALVTALALLVYAVVFMVTARARARYGIQAPAVTGAPEFERAFRIQQNTLEQLIWFLPALWLFAFYVSPGWAGILGLVWIGGRIHYALSYYRDPEARPRLHHRLRQRRGIAGRGTPRDRRRAVVNRVQSVRPASQSPISRRAIESRRGIRKLSSSTWLNSQARSNQRASSNSP